MTPQLYDGTVLVSTIPGNTKSFYKGNGDGIVWALDAATGKPKWKFNTVSDGAKLFGQPEGQQRRRPLVPACGRQPGARLHLRRQPGAAVRDQEVPERVEPPRAQPLHRTRSSPSTARPESGSGSGRPSATTCATTTCRSPRS